ncbi:hypothetical protein GCM10022198_11530 [Klugiella xanthotipulae]
MKGNRSSVSAWRVIVHTRECNDITLAAGITTKDIEQLTASFTPGEAYEFKMGWLSQRAATGFPFFTPTATDFRQDESGE